MVVTVLPAPPITSIMGAQLSCDGKPVEISASGTGTFFWTGPNGFQGTGPKVSVTNVGIYQVTLTGPNGCINTASAEVKAPSNAPVAMIQSPVQGTQLTCAVTQLPLNGSSSTSGSTYLWTRDGAFYSNKKDTSTTTAGKYVLVVTATGSGCTGSDTLVITQSIQPPSIQWVNLQTAITCLDKFAVLQASVSPSGSTLLWQGPGVTGNTDAQIVTDKAGTYVLKVTGTNGCSVITSQVVTIDTIAPRVLGTATSWSDCEKDQYGIEATAQPLDVLFQWHDPSGQPLTPGASIVVEGAGTYTLRLTGSNGCTAEAEHVIQAAKVTEPPTIITPNGDGKNDLLILSTCGQSNDPISLTIFNRWGQIVHRSGDYRDDWPLGNSADLPAGQYYYILEYQGKESKYPLTILKE